MIVHGQEAGGPEAGWNCWKRNHGLNQGATSVRQAQRVQNHKEATAIEKG